MKILSIIVAIIFVLGMFGTISKVVSGNSKSERTENFITTIIFICVLLQSFYIIFN